MSLLLDALKRAEQEKRARQAEGEAPVAAPASAAGSLELQPMAAGVAAAAPVAAARGEAHAAQTIFAAKAPTAAGKRKAVLWIAVGAIALVVLAGGGYVWYTMQALSPSSVAQRIPPPRPIVAAPAAPSTAVPVAAVANAPKTDAVPPVTAPKAEPTPPEPARAPAPQAAEKLVMNLLRDAAPTQAQPPLKLARSLDTPRVQPEVASGYENLRNGNLAAARRSYSAALAADPANLDAQLGMATVQARLGNRSAAVEHYRKALAIDPRNGTALAGLGAVADYSRPEALEAQLKADIARHPDNAPLQFTLGNFYATQARWGEAQAAFFEAYRVDPDNPDTLYNLAVSLDHLGQSKLAADFYRRAVDAARSRAAQFDAARAARRISELKP